MNIMSNIYRTVLEYNSFIRHKLVFTENHRTFKIVVFVSMIWRKKTHFSHLKSFGLAIDKDGRPVVEEILLLKWFFKYWLPVIFRLFSVLKSFSKFHCIVSIFITLILLFKFISHWVLFSFPLKKYFFSFLI